MDYWTRRLNARVAGTGPRTLVFGNGFGTNQHCWQAQIDSLTRDYRIVTLDFPGATEETSTAFDPARHGSLYGFAEDLSLLRWTPDGKPCSLAKFIPIAERSGLIVDLTAWVLRGVCMQIRAADRNGLAIGLVSVNISVVHFQQQDMPASLRRILHEQGLTPERICLEITETALTNPERCEATLHEVKPAGFRVSIDEFGTGFSSLAYLKRFRVDELKIGRSFVEGIATDETDRAIVSATISMGHSLGMRVVAEGVETEAQKAFLRQEGCDLLQGYALSRPLAPSALQEFLRRQTRAVGCSHPAG